MKILIKDFAQGKAIIRDAIYKNELSGLSKDEISILKIIKAREENIDFEIGLAERICGDNHNYPYRSSFYITKFFEDIGLNYQHDGSTRRLWIKDVLLELDSKEITQLIKNGLFRRIDFKNTKLRTDLTRTLSDEDFIRAAINDFKNFINDSLRAKETIDLTEVLDLNLNVDLIYQNIASTPDQELNTLTNEAKERYFKPDDQNVALEKIWDAFERMKTFYGIDKKVSANKLISKMAKDISESDLRNEFEILTKIGNTYRIRHHETDKKQLKDQSQVKYLFFRMLALIDLAISSLREDEDIDF